MTQEGLAAISQAYLGDVAYERIANAIVSGAFRPGEKLTIRSLADMLEISSTPVRDAVKRLLLENALEQRGPRDIRVPVITSDRYREIAEIRLELEGLAADRAARRRTEDDLVAMRRNIDENEEAIASGNWQNAVRLNKQFHFSLVDMADMPVLRGLLSGLWLQIGPPISSFYSLGGRDMIDRHYLVLDAIRDQRPGEARRHISVDISSSVDSIIAHISVGSADTARG
ncbi:GntR family transcriptional regulator [Pelagivirga sediminicola]|uniref:GntR family transcriptional regulator n=1 Tax=Pelagivirga sediminicola TaxID=2170575 RepID=A0A2T7G8F7_9RHOB|nr:GntR family transcriptional regulator [Pelagivirga sediminicola]PVA10694.1 GntR family transcriptional regulator [Pelagivirga sediminicola]